MAYYFEPPNVSLNAPLAVAGDLIVGRADGNFDRLAIGANGSFLNVSAGAIRWGNTIDTGGLTITAGDLVLTAGNVTIGGSRLFLLTDSAGITPATTQFLITNNANTQNNLVISDAGAVTTRSTLTVTAGGIRVTAGNVGIQSGTPLNALVVGGTGNANTDAGLEITVGSSITAAAYNRNSSAYVTWNLDASLIQIRPSGTLRLQVGTTGITNYNNIATAGWGVPAIYGLGRATGRVAAVASVAAYVVGAADGSFLVSGNVLVTASTTHSFQLECAYTDEGGTGRVVTFNVQQLGGTLVTTITNITGAGPYEGVPLHIRAQTGTTITVRTNAGGTYTSVTYNVEGAITQIA